MATDCFNLQLNAHNTPPNATSLSIVCEFMESSTVVRVSRKITVIFKETVIGVRKEVRNTNVIHRLIFDFGPIA